MGDNSMAKHLATGIALGLCLAASGAWAAAGETWEITHTLEFSGMALPSMTNKICMPKGAENDPRYSNGDKDCQVSDVKISGAKSTWKMRCTKGSEILTGIGEMTTAPERSVGLIKVSSSQGNMTMNYVSKRLGAACEAETLK